MTLKAGTLLSTEITHPKHNALQGWAVGGKTALKVQPAMLLMCQPADGTAIDRALQSPCITI